MGFITIAKWAVSASIFGLVFSVPSGVASAAVPETEASAIVLKLEGKGSAQVRRKSGVTSALGVNQEIFSGDKITTDKDALVEMGLVDGTIVKVGTNSEYVFTGAQAQKGILSHLFQLTKGSVRALIEKQTDKKSVKFRINTPAGTMGVRGTEILLTHNEIDETTKLFLLEGVANFGNPNCEKEKACISVKAGQWSKIKKGQKNPSAPQPFGGQDLLAETADSAGAKGQDPALLRLLGIKQEIQAMEKIQAKDLTALLAEASLLMQKAQNDLLGRDAAMRKAMEAAVADGTFDQYMRLAERFDDLKTGSKRKRTNEGFSAIAKTRKFALASAILKTGKVTLQKSTDKINTAGEAVGDNQPKPEGQILSAESDAGGSVQGKIDEAKAIAEKLNMAVTTGTTGSGKTVDQLDAKTVDQLIKDVVVFQTSEQYYKTFTYYEKCEWWQVFCGDEVYQGSWYEAETEKSLLKESTTVTKSAGTCYQLKETCGRILQPCDLSSGKFCTPIWKDECVESRVIVTCPQ